MSDTKCPFCGSDKIKMETPYVELGRDGEYHAKTTFCCKAQAANAKYVTKRFDPRNEDKPSPEEVSKW